MPSGRADPPSVPLRWRLALAFLRRLPQAALSRAAGRLAEIRIPRPFRGLVNGTFARLVGVDLTESEGSPRDYPSLSAFFVRGLRPGVRTWPDGDGIPGSPVDGRVGACGPLLEGTALQAKGIAYPVSELLGSPEDGSTFRQGWYVTVYLSPRHYHRIHAPVSGRIARARAIPGRLLPVNRHAVRGVRDLFPRNERLAVRIDTDDLRIAVVAVGAFNVGRIAAAFDPEWNGPGGRGVTNQKRSRRPMGRTYDPPLSVRRGDELMRFHLGSTVVLLVSPVGGSHGSAEEVPGLELHSGLVPDREIRLGDPLFIRA